MANAVLDVETGKMLEHRYLKQDPKYKDDWDKLEANKFGHLAQGVGDRIKIKNKHSLSRRKTYLRTGSEIALTASLCATSVQPKQNQIG